MRVAKTETVIKDKEEELSKLYLNEEERNQIVEDPRAKLEKFTIQVADNGAGISEEGLKQLFTDYSSL